MTETESRTSRMDRTAPLRLSAGWVQYLIAVVSAAIAVMVRWALDPVLGREHPYITLYVAVAATAWIAGWRPGVVALLIGLLAAELLFVPRSSAFTTHAHWLGLLLCAVSCGVIAGLGGAMHRARGRAEQKRGEILLKQEALEAEVCERKVAQKESEELRERLATELADMTRLHELSNRLLKQDELNPLLHEVLKASMELLQAPKGNIQLYDPRDKALKIVTQVGFTPEFMDRFRVVRDGESVCGTAAGERKRVIMEDADADPRFQKLAPVFAQHGFIAVQSTPLFNSDGNLLGMLSTHFSRPHRPSERELRLLDLYAQQAEQLIERRQHEDRLRRLHELSQAVNHASDLNATYESALEMVVVSLDANRASILLFDSDQVMRFKAWRGLSDDYRRAVEGHFPWRPDEVDPQPVCIEDVAAVPLEDHLREVIQKEGIRSLSFIPLVCNQRLVGKFMAYYDHPHRFGARELRLAQTIAGQVALAIERQRSQEALRESEARLRTALDAGNLGVWEWDIVRDRLVWSERLFEFHGVDPQRFDGNSFAFFRLVHPEDQEKVRHALDQALHAGAPYEVEFRSVRPNGEVRWFKTAARVIFDQQGLPVRMLGGTFDLTDRKLLEDQLQWHARHLDRLVQEQTARLRETVLELESFSYTIAHDMRAPLRAMHGFAQLLENGHSESIGPDGKDCIRRIVSSARRMDHLIQDVLSYSRIARTELRLETVNLHQLVSDVLETYPMFHQPHALVRIDGQLSEVLGNEALLMQCFSNLIENGVKFVAPGVVPQVVIRCESLESGVRVWVEDNGIGIAPAFQEKIFGVFQRLNRSYEGTGIGLAIVRRAVERMGGRVGVESEPGSGSRFWIELQRPQAAAADADRHEVRSYTLISDGAAQLTEKDSLLLQRNFG